jgi:hypothetical protein
MFNTTWETTACNASVMEDCSTVPCKIVCVPKKHVHPEGLDPRLIPIAARDKRQLTEVTGLGDCLEPARVPPVWLPWP